MFVPYASKFEQNRLIQTTRHFELLDKKTVFLITIFDNLSKAFDTLNHDILLDKLYAYGIRGLANSWFKNSLSGRKQYVSYTNTNSAFNDIVCGVPQGSILGPLLFLLYI